ncbi:bifunctional protein-disulfide isomerase/oxidoreductase DsbC [Psychromonas ossibalaenae]|uniref:bifunctional protein-disulfide isomerase/oxidoreductase DsbC n=1 Tax=Psychromonas ossibalaenae TaxID=444922 RepID=UPI000374DBD8|nr:bifunctional protein-disulfide isomerase/oxidoreductase DsbC [Psychromonas ossibalaenae]
MRTIFSKTGVACLFVLTSFSSFTSAAEPVSKEISEKIAAKMQILNIPADSISKSTVDGLYEVTAGGDIYYVSEDTQYLVHGNIYDLDNQMHNLTEQKRAKLSKDKISANLNKLQAFEKDMIVYKAENEKHVITVFTDTSCGYCRKLHAEIEDYNKLGITVRYLAFPRGGINTATYNTMVSIWCADDPTTAMNLAKGGKQPEYKTCKNTVKEQYELGLFFGVKGTPAIILEDGSLKPGYLPANRLIQALEQK